MRRLSRLLMGAALGLGAGLGAAHFSALRGLDWLVPALVLSPLAALLVLLFQIRREEGAGTAFAAFFQAALGAGIASALVRNWLEPLGLIPSTAMLPCTWVCAAWGSLLAAVLINFLPGSAMVPLILTLMLASGSVLIAALAVLCLIFLGVRSWARR